MKRFLLGLVMVGGLAFWRLLRCANAAPAVGPILRTQLRVRGERHRAGYCDVAG